MEQLTVNVEELNYLVKRLDSFDTGEAAQFQAMAHKLELFELKDLINLTFCCQQATVITDFSDLAAIGRDHYMNLHGGSASVDELNALDGKGTARQLVESGSGTITPYGVVYDNGMKLEQIYDGRFFPCYYYEPNVITVAVTSKAEPEDTEHNEETRKFYTYDEQGNQLSDVGYESDGETEAYRLDSAYDAKGRITREAYTEGGGLKWVRTCAYTDETDVGYTVEETYTSYQSGKETARSSSTVRYDAYGNEVYNSYYDPVENLHETVEYQYISFPAEMAENWEDLP